MIYKVCLSPKILYNRNDTLNIIRAVRFSFDGLLNCYIPIHVPKSAESVINRIIISFFIDWKLCFSVGAWGIFSISVDIIKILVWEWMFSQWFAAESLHLSVCNAVCKIWVEGVIMRGSWRFPLAVKQSARLALLYYTRHLYHQTFYARAPEKYIVGML